MRTIEYHKINPTNDTLDVVVKDAPSHGGASHVYEVHHASTAGIAPLLAVNFQNGPIGEHGVNGVVYSNPLPHVLILTAIVVGVATLAVGLAIAVRIREAFGTVEAEEIESLGRVESTQTGPSA